MSGITVSGNRGASGGSGGGPAGSGGHGEVQTGGAPGSRGPSAVSASPSCVIRIAPCGCSRSRNAHGSRAVECRRGGGTNVAKRAMRARGASSTALVLVHALETCTAERRRDPGKRPRFSRKKIRGCC